MGTTNTFVEVGPKSTRSALTKQFRGIFLAHLHPVAVVNVDVDVEHARVVLEQLKDGQHDVVHVAEPRRFRL